MNYRALTAAILTVLIGGGLYFYESPELPAEPTDKKVNKPPEKRGIGIIDIEKVQAAHPDGELLDQLLAREFRLRLELNEAMRIVQLPKPPAPEPNTKVFDDAAWQKNAQLVISQLAELETKRKAAAEEYRKNSEPRYIEERNKIRDKYMNENFNIQLKLQNADNLRLPQEKINELIAQLEALELERNNIQKELLDKWLAEIEKYAEESVAEEEAKLKAEADRLQQEVEEQARQKEAEVAERNRKLMEESLNNTEDRQIRRRELLAELQEVGAERADLEKKILSSIEDKVIMLAAVNRLEMVLVKSSPIISDKVLRRGMERNFELKAPERVGTVIFPGKDTRDLTDDLIKEMERDKGKVVHN